MKTFNQIKDQVHDASGIDDPWAVWWVQHSGVWYPSAEIHLQIKNEDGSCTIRVQDTDIEITGVVSENNSGSLEFLADWYYDDESEEFYDNNWELIDSKL